MNNLHQTLRASTVEQCVVWFREAQLSRVEALLGFMLTRYRLYLATDADGSELFDPISAEDFSALRARTSGHYSIDFYSDAPPLFRPRFHLTPTEHELFDVKLHFDLFEFPDPPPVAELLDLLQQFASILQSWHWSLHQELNDHWHSGDFSAATLLYEKQDETA